MKEKAPVRKNANSARNFGETLMRHRAKSALVIAVLLILLAYVLAKISDIRGVYRLILHWKMLVSFLLVVIIPWIWNEQFRKYANSARIFGETTLSRRPVESVLVVALLLTLLAYSVRETTGGHIAHDLIPYWKLLVAVLLLTIVSRTWHEAGRPSVVIIPFDVTLPAPVRGLSGTSLARLVFDGIKSASEEEQNTANDIGQKNFYQPELPKVTPSGADQGSTLTLDYKGLSIDSLLNFMRRLRGTLAVITGELINDDTGVVIRCRCSIPAFFGSGVSKSHRESTAVPIEGWKLREAVRELSRMLAADLKREEFHKLPPKEAGLRLVDLGRTYFSASVGDKEDNLLEAIRCYDEALKIFKKKTHPVEWARTLNNRGNAYRQLRGPNPIANVREAMNCYDLALDVCNRATDVRGWAGTMSNRGLALQQLPDSNGQSENLRQAINCYRQALEVFKREKRNYLFDWARTSRNMANAFTALPWPDRIANIRQALEVYEAVRATLEQIDQKDEAVGDTFKQTIQKELAFTMSAAANAYRQLPDRGENLRKAILYFDYALGVYTRDGYPEDWANIMVQKGNALRELMGPDRGGCLREAISCYDQALQVFSKEKYPTQWANTLNQKGVAYRDLPGPERIHNLAEALSCLDSALSVFDRSSYPVEWATTQNLRGSAYQQLSGPDRSANLLAAIRCYESALQVVTPADFPTQWAQCYRNQANAYAQLPGPDRAANLRRAIRAYEEVEKVFTKVSYPEEWARTMNLIGIAYRELRVPYQAPGDTSSLEKNEPAEEKRGLEGKADAAIVK